MNHPEHRLATDPPPVVVDRPADRLTVAPGVTPDQPVMQPTVYRPRRSIWPGLLGAAVIGGVVGALVISNVYDTRSIGQKVDASIAAVTQQAQETAAAATEQGARATETAAAVLDDAGITAAVKTALAADPSLSALKIDVDTNQGVVRLTGPAPDAQARERAGVLAAAPKGVRSVDNLLTVAPAGNG